MTKEMIVSSNDHETMVAILEDDQVVELFIERERNRGVVGNVYKGRVSKVLPGMQSAFVDIGLERDGFLYVTDVVSTSDQFEQLEASDGRAACAPSRTASPSRRRLVDRSRRPQPPGSRRPPARQGEQTNRPSPQGRRRRFWSRSSRSRSARRAPGSPATSSIPGRFLVFMPTVDHVGVSRKIESRDERGRLRGIVRQFREQHAFTGGVIIRTAAAGRPEGDILGDLNDFLQIWQEIRQRVDTSRARRRSSTASRAWSPSCCAIC